MQAKRKPRYRRRGWLWWHQCRRRWVLWADNQDSLHLWLASWVVDCLLGHRSLLYLLRRVYVLFLFFCQWNYEFRKHHYVSDFFYVLIAFWNNIFIGLWTVFGFSLDPYTLWRVSTYLLCCIGLVVVIKLCVVVSGSYQDKLMVERDYTVDIQSSPSEIELHNSSEHIKISSRKDAAVVHPIFSEDKMEEGDQPLPEKNL